MTSTPPITDGRLREPVAIATGFVGGEPVSSVGSGEPQQVDLRFVIVPPAEAKTKAQPHTGTREVGIFTAIVLAARSRLVTTEASHNGRTRVLGAPGLPIMRN